MKVFHENARVAVEMTEMEYNQMLVFLGIAADRARDQLRWKIRHFMNVLNANNKHYVPYVIPEEHQP